jgi:hypothetical protein
VQKAWLLGHFSIYYCKGKNGECIPNQTIQDKVHTVSSQPIPWDLWDLWNNFLHWVVVCTFQIEQCHFF